MLPAVTTPGSITDRITTDLFTMTRLVAVVVLCAVCSLSAAGQSPVTGTVMDAYSHEPVTGARIQNLRSHSGTTTLMNGTFEITATRPGDTLLVGCTGYTPLKVVAAPHLSLLIKPAMTSLGELVVSASRDIQKRTEAPVAISAISADQIRKARPVTLDQVLNQVSGVYMVDLGNEQHTMAIRQPIGYRSNFLYLEDGIPIRTIGDFNHNALLEINQADIRRIEVIKGPSSSLYGSDAVGGAVNFITKSPALVPDATLSLQGSNRGYRRADVTASNTFRHTGVLVSGYYASQHHGYMDHSDFHKTAVTGRVRHQLGERSQLTGTATFISYHTDQNGGLDSAHFFGKDYHSFYTFNYRKVRALRASVSWRQQHTQHGSSVATLYYRNNEVAQNPAYRLKNTAAPLKASGELNRDYFQSFGLLVQDSRKLPFWNTRLMVGVHGEISPAGYRAHYIEVDKNTKGYFTGFTSTDSLLTDYRADLLNAAGYVQIQTSPVPRLRIVGGLRYDLLQYRFRNLLTPSAYTGAPDGTNTFRQLSPKVGMTYDFGKDRGAYLNYSIGFAPPDISDLYTGVSIPYLSPARYYNFETGGWLTFQHHKGYIDLSLYRMIGTGEIISVKNADGSAFNQNAGRTLHYGIEYTLTYKPLDWLALRAGGTEARHRFRHYTENGKRYDGNEMNGAPPWIMNAAVTVTPGFVKHLSASLEWEHLSGYYMDPGNTLRYPGYDVCNLRLRYRWKQCSFWANLINCGNTVYATVAEKTAYSTAYRPGPLRTLYLGMEYHFTKHAGKMAR